MSDTAIVKQFIGGLVRRYLMPVVFILGAAFALVVPIWRASVRAVFWVVYAPLNLLLTSPVGTWMRARAHMNSPLEQLERESQRLAAREQRAAEAHQQATGELAAHQDRVTWHLVFDEREKAAELVVPRAQYPALWTNVPRDLQRSIVQDGRLVNGEPPAQRLAGATLGPEFVTRAWSAATLAGARGAWVTLLGLVLLSLSAAYLAGKTRYDRASAAYSAAASSAAVELDVRTVAREYRDAWAPQDAQELVDLAKKVKPDAHAESAAGKTEAVVTAIGLLIGLLAGSVIVAVAVGRYVWLGRLRYLVFAAADGGVASLRGSWREALQRWRWRLEQREVEAQAYADQVKFATEVDRSPVIELGTSLGELEYRGHLLAPPQGTPVRMSVVDLLQHVQVLGGSGEGKSRNFYIPLVRQLLQLRAKGFPIAVYATDDKGAIGADIVDIAREVGVPDEDVLVIGTRPDEWKVNLLDGLAPAEFADIVRSVSAQTGGDGGGDDFWPSMASDLLLNVATVLQAAEATDQGFEFVRREGRRMYSIIRILEVASSDELTRDAVRMVMGALQDRDGQYQYVQSFDRPGLLAAVEYLTNSWLPMAQVTRDGIRANARKALRGFAHNEAIATGFADGSGAKLLPASALLTNKVKIIQISQIEHGSAGRLVAIMLKTLFFKLARAREQADPGTAKARLKWWFNPRPESLTPALADTLAINFFLADEYQALVTASKDDGLSDASVWNVLRSAGVAGVLLSQSVSAFTQAVGEKAAANMRSNWRTVILLRTEDVATIETAQRLAGKVLRFHTSDWGHMESAVAVRRETGAAAEQLRPSPWRSSYDALPALFPAGHYSRFAFSDYENPYDLDERFVPNTWPGDGSAGANAVLAAEQAAAWRQEDLTRQAMQAGMSEFDAVRSEDLMQMGRGRALVFVQRAGGTRVEFVKLGE